MAESLVGQVETNERQYNIPLHASVIQWEWVCVLYGKKSGNDFYIRHSEAKIARQVADLQIERKPLAYKEWELYQVMVPIAV